MTRTILLADDSVTIQKVVELTFLDEDFRVVAFGNGAEAIERVADLAPDVVLADVHMPGADGYELCAAARASHPGLPVLLLVGTFEVFDAERADEVGAAGHLKKPFDSQDLLRQVKDLVATAGDAPSLAAEAAAAPAPEAGAGGATGVAPTPEPPEPPAVAEAPSWSFEPAALPTTETEVVPGISAEIAVEMPAETAAEFSADTWGGVEPPEFEAVAEVAADPAAVDEPAPSPDPPAAEVQPDTSPAFVPEPPAQVAEPVAQAGPAAGARELAEADIDRIARRVVALLGDQPVRDVAWEVVPDLAEVLLKARIRELEASVE